MVVYLNRRSPETAAKAQKRSVAKNIHQPRPQYWVGAKKWAYVPMKFKYYCGASLDNQRLSVVATKGYRLSRHYPTS
jgi:hypothetical protein